MQVKIEEMIGKRFGKLVIKQLIVPGYANKRKYLCQCDCGGTKIVSEDNLKRGHTKSCGCHKRGTYGDSNTRLYGIWNSMLNRCEYKKMPSFKYYGARGIKVCEKWHNFKNFKKWAIENGYSESLTIDRIENSGNYEPTNCRWVTFSEQANNRRNSKVFTVNGETHTIKEWAKIKNVNEGTLRSRIWCRNWSPEMAINTPIGNKGHQIGAPCRK